MITIHNPARSRPLSKNVKRLMKLSREDPLNPYVTTISRKFVAKDFAYCDMQGSIFMAAIDRGLTMEEFVPCYMTSQLAGVIDHSFSCAAGMENDGISKVLEMPMLLKSPEVIVDVVLWLDKIVGMLKPEESANMAVINACVNENVIHTADTEETQSPFDSLTLDELADEYEYAYWLGYIYRFECLLHAESSRMVYGAFDEKFMRKTYKEMFGEKEGTVDTILADSALEICRRLDTLLVGKLWK